MRRLWQTPHRSPHWELQTARLSSQGHAVPLRQPAASAIHSIPCVHLFFFGPHCLMVFLGRMVFKKSLSISVSSTPVPEKSCLCPTTGGNAACFCYSLHSSITRKGQRQLLTSCPFRHELNTSSGVRLLLKNTDKLSKGQFSSYPLPVLGAQMVKKNNLTQDNFLQQIFSLSLFSLTLLYGCNTGDGLLLRKFILDHSLFKCHLG